MSDYSKGKIYKIVCNESGEVYIGSTVLTLKQRLWKHKDGNRDCSSTHIIDRGDFEMILIDEYSCNSDLELRMREQYWLDKIPNINKYRAYQSKEEKAIYQKEYRNKNKEKLAIYNKEYRSLNKEKVASQRKKISEYQNTFCGNYHHNTHNNLLRISVDLFS